MATVETVLRGGAVLGMFLAAGAFLLAVREHASGMGSWLRALAGGLLAVVLVTVYAITIGSPDDGISPRLLYGLAAVLCAGAFAGGWRAGQRWETVGSGLMLLAVSAFLALTYL